MGSAWLQPALWGGLAIGVLTVLPVVNLVNLCCCAWVICGGALAAYLLQQNQPAPITPGDGVLVGVMAGVFGAIIGSVLAVPMALALGPFQAAMLERALETARDMPPEVRDLFEQWRYGMAEGVALGATFVVSLLLSLVFYSIFGLIGGLLGAVLFRREAPPPVPPPFEPPRFTPPPPPPAAG